MGIFDYQSGNSQGILIHVLGMNPVLLTIDTIFVIQLHFYFAI